MAEFIERKKVFADISRLLIDGAILPDYEDGINRATIDALNIIEKAPVADVLPGSHGYWIPIFENAADEKRGVAMKYKCSECGNTAKDETYSHAMDYEFCPHCGAKMDGKLFRVCTVGTW